MWDVWDVDVVLCRMDHIVSVMGAMWLENVLLVVKNVKKYNIMVVGTEVCQLMCSL